jgi:hypothetical protein
MMFETRLDAQLWSHPVGKKRAHRAERAEAMLALASDMEHPLEQARLLAMAMRLLGQGMIADYNPECGEPVFAIGDVMKDRLEEALKLWERLFDAAGALASADPGTPA